MNIPILCKYIPEKFFRKKYGYDGFRLVDSSPAKFSFLLNNIYARFIFRKVTSTYKIQPTKTGNMWRTLSMYKKKIFLHYLLKFIAWGITPNLVPI